MGHEGIPHQEDGGHQKLPEKWEVMVEHIIDRVDQKQMPKQRPDGSFHPGVTYAKMGNTDQVPVYI